MSRILIGIPTIDKVDASFFSSVLGLKFDDRNQYAYSVASNSLVYDARGDFSVLAINGNYDYLVMLDSDLVFASDLVTRLVSRIKETGADLVTGLYFRRRLPTGPLIVKSLDWYDDETLGPQQFVDDYVDYPRDDVFKIEGCGMGCVVISVDALRETAARFRMNPFTPLPKLSEDYSFCFRMKSIGKKMLCDSSIKPLHAGLHLYGEQDWIKQKEEQTND